MLWVAAIDVAPRGVFEKRKFLRPVKKGVVFLAVSIYCLAKRPTLCSSIVNLSCLGKRRWFSIELVYVMVSGCQGRRNKI